MNKKLGITIGLAVLLIAVAAGIFLLPNKAESPQVAKREFTALPNSSSSYVASIAKTSENNTYYSLFEHSNDDASRYSTEQDSVISSEVYSGEATYSCSSAACEKVTRDDNTGQYAYSYDPGKLESIKQTATFVNDEACGTGVVCAVWSWKNERALQSSTDRIYVNNTNNMIEKVVSVYDQSGSQVTVQYKYQPVTITVPPVPTDIPRSVKSTQS